MRVLMVAMGFTYNYTLMIVLRILLGAAEGAAVPAGLRHCAPQLPRSICRRAHHAVVAGHAR